MEDGAISDGQISASSAHRKYFGPADARLNFSGNGVRGGAWMAGTQDHNQWLQVDLGDFTIVTGIDTQGRGAYRVKKYTVSYSQDNVTFHGYKHDGNVKALS